MVNDTRFIFSMFFLRASVFLVMLMWTLDKFIQPEHTAAVFKHFYSIPDLGNTVAYALGSVQLIILVLFFIGFKKTFTYGVILILHAISTFVSFGKYLAPYDGSNLLFFAAWPMLAACVMLFVFRKEDSFLQIENK